VHIRSRIDAVIDRALSEKKIVGAVVCIAKEGEQVYARAAGFADREAQKPIAEKAIFRLASVTKPLVSATALALIEHGLLSLEDKVATYLPYFTPRTADGAIAAITIRHLLTHTSGLGYDYSADPSICTGLRATDFDYEQNFSRVAKFPLSFAPGERWQYSVSTDVLGAVVAKAAGSTLEEAVAKYVTVPLGMNDTAFHVVDIERLATPYGDASPEPSRMGDPHDVIDAAGNKITFSPGRIFNRKAFQSGGAGAAGSAPDLLIFLETLRMGGGAILKPETVDRAFANQIGDVAMTDDHAGKRFSFLGAVHVDPAAAQSPCAPGTLDWGGIYGHAWYVDRRNALTIVSFTNTAVEGCVGRFPKDVCAAVYG
jgi:CubicO group peptidase (beta-lactamase class C family)